jgi:hypothetical protein
MRFHWILRKPKLKIFTVSRRILTGGNRGNGDLCLLPFLLFKPFVLAI